MLADLHTSLRTLLHDRGRIPRELVDVRFEAPRREWVNALTRPTLDLFLFDVKENLDLRRGDIGSATANGRAVYRMPARRFDLRYMVSALASTVEDEHLLLWRALSTLLQFPDFPVDTLAESLRTLEPGAVMQVKTPEEAGLLLDLWTALESPPHPAFLFVVTVPLEIELTREAPLVFTRTMRYHPDPELTGEPDVRRSVGGIVRSRGGRPLAGAAVSIAGAAGGPVTTDNEGRYVLAGVPAGTVSLLVVPAEQEGRTTRLEVPSESYDIVVD